MNSRLVLLCLFLTGCSVPPHVGLPKGGTALQKIGPVGQARDQSLRQPDAPEGPSTQAVNFNHTIVQSVAPVSRVTETVQPSGAKTTVTETLTPASNSSDTTVSTSEQVLSATSTAAVNSSAASANLVTQLSFLRPLQWIGALLLLIAIAAFYPPIATLFRVKPVMQAELAGAGIALMVAPIYLVAYQKQIFFICILVILVTVVIHYHTAIETELESVLKPTTPPAPNGTVTTTTTTAPVLPGTPGTPNLTK